MVGNSHVDMHFIDCCIYSYFILRQKAPSCGNTASGPFLATNRQLTIDNGGIFSTETLTPAIMTLIIVEIQAK